ncbi:unnamed protein product [Clonostachys rosea]|uniref:LITAF domain-containing protein n=1 Tax=Bionectria ochroleuca TaxID=29856 RepID=A0ABY6UAZ2_BIOOC|nr:unnamed protein product [Clonostachys rosea]
MTTQFLDPTTGRMMVIEPEPQPPAYTPTAGNGHATVPTMTHDDGKPRTYETPDDIRMPARPKSTSNSTNVDRNTLPELATAEARRQFGRDDVSTSKEVLEESPRIVAPLSGSSLDEEHPTVTPLHLLGDQSDMIDCPFCRRRTETRVKKHPSVVTHVTATTLFVTTVVGAAAPYVGRWSNHISHYCTNCDHKVAHKRFYSSEMKSLGTPEHLREASQYEPTKSP